LVLALLHRLGKLTPNRWWGSSALASLLFGIAGLAMGAGCLAEGLVGAESSLPFSPMLCGALVFFVALLGGFFAESRHRRK